MLDHLGPGEMAFTVITHVQLLKSCNAWEECMQVYFPNASSLISDCTKYLNMVSVRNVWVVEKHSSSENLRKVYWLVGKIKYLLLQNNIQVFIFLACSSSTSFHCPNRRNDFSVRRSAQPASKTSQALKVFLH